MTGEPKFSYLKEDSIVLESREIAVPGNAGRLQGHSAIEWGRARGVTREVVSNLKILKF